MERYIEEAETFIKLDTYQLWISPSGQYTEKFEQPKDNWKSTNTIYSSKQEDAS